MPDYSMSHTGEDLDETIQNYLNIKTNNNSILTPLSTPGTTGQFLRGDGQWSNTLIGNLTATKFIGNLEGNADTATKLQTAGTTGQFYRGDRTWSNTIIGDLNATKLLLTDSLHLYSQTYGNTASDLVSNTAGVMSWGDKGPQITFDTSPTPGGAQAGAILFTDHDAAGTGVSWHFVSNQSECNVVSPRFHAKTGISIGQPTPYNYSGLAIQNGNLKIGNATNTTRYIQYQDGTNTFNPITFYSGADVYGMGIGIGAGGRTIIAGGEASSVFESVYGASSELLILANDGDVHIFTGQQNGYNSSYHHYFNNNGLQVGVKDTAMERQVSALSGAGRIYLYSVAATNGNRGLWGNNNAGTGAAIVTTNQSNANSFPTSSDRRIKIPRGLSSKEEIYNILNELEINNFNYILDNETELVNNVEHIGIYAQDLRDLLLKYNYKNRNLLFSCLKSQNTKEETETDLSTPEMSQDISIPEEEIDLYEINYTAFIPMLIKGWQIQQEEIEVLKERINLLEQGR